MTLVQIDLRRGRDLRPMHAEPDSAAGEPPVPTQGAGVSAIPGASAGPAASANPAASVDPIASASPWIVLAVGMILLVPLAGPALHSGSALALLLVGLSVLGLIAAFLRPHAGVEPP